MTNPRFLITGTTGFIGSHLVDVYLLNTKLLLFHVALKNSHILFSYEQLFSSDSDCIANFMPTHIIHAAGIAHRRPPRKFTDMQHLFDVNIQLPLRIAALAKKVDARQFIFISTIGVHGSSSSLSSPITEGSSLQPQNLYSYSKLLAENALASCLENSATKLCTIRPCLVYGKNAPGNLLLNGFCPSIFLCLSPLSPITKAFFMFESL